MPGAPTAALSESRWCSPGWLRLAVAVRSRDRPAVLAIVASLGSARHDRRRLRARPRPGAGDRGRALPVRSARVRQPAAAAGGRAHRPLLDAPLAARPPLDRRVDRGAVPRGAAGESWSRRALEIQDPLGMRTRGRFRGRRSGEVLVLPRIEPVARGGRGVGGAASAIAGTRGRERPGRLDARAIELEIDGLRAYREGSPASRIHWPAVARTGELIERRLVAGADRRPWSCSTRLPPRPEALDAAVRAAALALRAPGRRGRLRALLPGDRRPTEIEPEHARLACRARAAGGRRGRRAPAPVAGRAAAGRDLLGHRAAGTGAAAALRGQLRAALPRRPRRSPDAAGAAPHGRRLRRPAWRARGRRPLARVA